MIEWFFFDGIYAETRALSVCRQLHLTFNVLPHKAEAAIAGLHVTFTRTKVTDNTSVLFRRVPPAAGNVTCAARL